MTVSHLSRQVSINCPLPQAAQRLGRFFHGHGNADGDTVKLNLGIDVVLPGSNTALAVRRAVIATIQPHHLAADMTPRYRVRWAPEVPRPLPLFAGELLVCGDDDFNTFSLQLSGTYTPPLGHVGQGFDMAIGHRVADATADDLLARVKHAIERDFQSDEARKQ